MISALDKYRAPKMCVASENNIKEYLKKKYSPENVRETAAEIESLG